LVLYPVSYRITRVSSLALGFLVWFGLIALLWQQRAARFALLGITVLTAAFLALPGRGRPPIESLRGDYLKGLRRYEGVTYYWGGETSRGIDCSGLIRRGLIDALLWRGLRTFDAGFVREAINLWWHDCTASALGEQHRGLTQAVVGTPSINALDHSQILPGDLAVTKSGIHIMAYLGDKQWIEADPMVGEVITVTVPSASNGWFETPMNIVRWSILQ
jgi:NlpC/P60 family